MDNNNLITHRHIKLPKGMHYKYGGYENKQRTLRDVKKNKSYSDIDTEFPLTYGIKPITLKKGQKFRYIETDIEMALVEVLSIYGRIKKFYERPRLDIPLREQRKFKKETIDFMMEEVPRMHLDFVNNFGMMLTLPSLKKEMKMVGETQGSWEWNIFDLGRLHDYSTNQYWDKIVDYFKRKDTGARFHLYPRLTEDGLAPLVHYEAYTLKDAIEHAIVQQAQLVARHKRCLHCGEVMEVVRASKTYCSEKCKVAHFRNKQHRSRYENNTN